MSILATCTKAGCSTVTIGGGRCLAHDDRVRVEFVRGRPFVRPQLLPPQERQLKVTSGPV